MSENIASAKATENDIVVEKKRLRGKDRKPSPDPSFNMDELRELADLVDAHGLTDFEFENENIRVRLSKMQAAPAPQHAPAVSHSAPPATAQDTISPAEATATVEAAGDPDINLHKITSPIVGTFYSSPGPDKDAYVSEGSIVTPETTVCIVEAMKLMNEIQAEVSGEIVKIYVENGQPVEYGQALFGVRK